MHSRCTIQHPPQQNRLSSPDVAPCEIIMYHAAPPYSKLHLSTLQNYILNLNTAKVCTAMKTVAQAMESVINNGDGRWRISAAEERQMRK